MSYGTGINFAGLASGIDTESIVRQLIQLEQIPIRRLQTRQAELQARMGIYGQFKSTVQSLASAAASLNTAAAFNPIKATSSDTAVATITAGSATNAGIYSLTVSKLAQSHKIANLNPQASVSEALGMTGQFVVNGRVIDVTATDSLTTIATKINAESVGATASIIDGGPNMGYLTITSNNGGAANKIQIADLGSGNVLSSLGMVAGAPAIREAITGGAASWKFSSNTASLATMLDTTAFPSGLVSIGTGSITVDGNDTLQTIADKINNPGNGTGATATVVSSTENGVTKYRLEITGTTTFGAENNVWQALGVLQRGYGNQLVGAQDAEFTLDGVALTSTTNEITTAIPGATLTLLQADAGTPKTATLTLSRDTESIKKAFRSFKDAHNAILDYIKAGSSFDTETYESGPLFGDFLASQVESTISSLVYSSVTTGGAFSNLTQLGFSTDEVGKLTLDEAALDNALATDPEAVGKLMRSIGTTSSNDLTFVSNGTKTQASSGAGFLVNITQIATKGYHVAGTAQTTGNPANETLTFGGALFGSDYNLVLDVGSTLADTINKINNDATLKGKVIASDDGGRLKIESKAYGTNGNFTVVSDLAAASDNSGIGDGTIGFTAGLDVAGTINGEETTGSGQFLTGKAGNATTDSLQIQYTGSLTGDVGYIKFTKGVAALMQDAVNGLTDSTNGLFTTSTDSLQSQFDELGTNITDLEARLKVREESLRRKFAAMEQALTQLQAQSARLSSMASQMGR
ncbi:MAG: hypothetical protein HONBIEJF_02846 [Fimbriimonadaceae bacterium]|nr:hypothetical protein [Fimbriimonadaceae bacterium]